MHQTQLTFNTPGRSTLDISDKINKVVQQANCETGLCNLFLHHTSASLILCENADPQVREDLETFMSQLVPDGDPRFLHDMEGPDDMPAHVRTILTQNSLSIPIAKQRLLLGTWQGIYLWEHRTHEFTRKITVTILSNDNCDK